MSLELGISVGMAILCFILAYFSVNEDKFYFKWFFISTCFGFMAASTDVFSRLATSEGLDANIIGMFNTLTVILIILTSLLLFIFFIIAIQYAIEMWYPNLKKKKSFNQGY